MTFLDDTLTIPFTQFHLPNGRRTEELFLCENKETAELAKKIIDAGGRFEAEVLRTGHVSLTVTYDVDVEDGRQDIAIKVVENGPSVATAIDELAKDAWTYITEA